MMKKLTHKIPVLILMASSLSACGGQAYRENGGTPTNTTGNIPGSSSGPTTPTTTGSDPTVVGTVDNTIPMQSEEFTLAGTTTPPNGSTRPGPMTHTISGIITDNRLRVVVSGGPAQPFSGGGFTVGLNCLQVRVTVNGSSQTAFVTNTGSPGYGYCNGAVASQTLNFDGQATPGHGAMSVTIDNPMYDNCRLYGNIYSGGCPITAVYWSHQVDVKVGVQTNGTN
jgi:hypothetical protein